MKGMFFTLLIMSLAAFFYFRHEGDEGKIMEAIPTKEIAQATQRLKNALPMEQLDPLAAYVKGSALSAKEAATEQRVVEGIVDDFRYVNAKWQDFRDQVYSGELGLSEEKIAQIRALREEYTEKLADLAKKIHAASADRKAQLTSEIAAQSGAFNEGVESIVGEEKFSALKEWKDYFNRQMKKEVRTDLDVNSSSW